MHSGGGVKVVVSAGVSKNGPGAVLVEETFVLVGVLDCVLDRATMIACPQIRRFLEKRT